MLTFAEKLRSLRESRGLSVRAAAKQLGVSAPFLSDIELGRRFPSEEVLERMALLLEIPLDELRKFDLRAPVSAMRHLADTNPEWGFAFRTAIDKAKKGLISPQDLENLKGKDQ